MSQQLYALQARHALPNEVKYWTREGDYTDDITKAITGKTREELERFLEAQKHVRPHVRIVPAKAPAGMDPHK